ncbi:hypothetical protein [Streptosporangium carneum]|uniref:Subtilisin inhibitor domain-containing protein n=1 Tax=Streptosporangium carneum TaxID=47481 RepID=A0A9W6MDN5_9ACTN|nr:hypothetical protein [Streptosporangium carneum]GLK10346.1 hypothetical protein GCM10017600_37520 [Streptosporangium carneum]
MKRIIAAAALLMITTFGLVATGTTAQAQPARGAKKTPVSESQYQTLLNQCEYADTERRRAACRAMVSENYQVTGEENPGLDCREYAGVAVCGPLDLSPAERRCVKSSVDGGLTYRRAEVECYAFS